MVAFARRCRPCYFSCAGPAELGKMRWAAAGLRTRHRRHGRAACMYRQRMAAILSYSMHHCMCNVLSDAAPLIDTVPVRACVLVLAPCLDAVARFCHPPAGEGFSAVSPVSPSVRVPSLPFATTPEGALICTSDPIYIEDTYYTRTLSTLTRSHSLSLSQFARFGSTSALSTHS